MMEGFASVFAVVALLGAAVTKAVDLVRNLPFFKDKAIGSWIWNALALVFGVALCVGWEHSFVQELVAQVPALAGLTVPDWLGFLLSGLIVGGFAGFFHELFDSLSSIANRNNSTAAATEEFAEVVE